MVGLVHDQVEVFRQDPVFGGYVGQEQRVIDNKDVSQLSALAGEVQRAPFLGAYIVRAGVILGVQTRPGQALAGRSQRNLGHVAGGRLGKPIQHPGE